MRTTEAELRDIRNELVLDLFLQVIEGKLAVDQALSRMFKEAVAIGRREAELATV